MLKKTLFFPRRSWLFLLPALLLLSSQSSSFGETLQKPEAKSPADFLRQSGFSSVRLKRTIYHLVIKVKINGRTANMVVATNNPISQIDRKLLGKFELKETPYGVPITGALGGSQEFGMATVQTLAISKAVLHEIPVAIVNLNIRRGAWKHTDFDRIDVLREEQRQEKRKLDEQLGGSAQETDIE